LRVFLLDLRFLRLFVLTGLTLLGGVSIACGVTGTNNLGLICGGLVGRGRAGGVLGASILYNASIIIMFTVYRMKKTLKLRQKSKHKKSRKSRKQRKTQKQRGAGFGFEIPPDAIVEYRNMDDNGTNPPRLVTMRDRPDPFDSERA